MNEHASSQSATTPRRSNANQLEALGVAAIVAVAAALARTTMSRTTRRVKFARPSSHEQRDALKAYLIDHLTGSDAAYRVVGRLRHSEAGTPAGALFADLYNEFKMERSIVELTIKELGGWTTSPRRMVGKAAGSALEAVAGGVAGDLALFRTLETLAIGVQGKRLLWRALERRNLDYPSTQKLCDLEALALDQWTRIENTRLSLIPKTFGTQEPR